MWTLFSTDLVRDNNKSVEGAGDCSLFTMKELEESALSMKNKQRPQPEGNSAEIYKLMFHHRSRTCPRNHSFFRDGTFTVAAVMTVVDVVHRADVTSIDLND